MIKREVVVWIGYLVSWLLLTNGCASVETKPRHFSLATAQKIIPGKSTKADILALLGEPDEHLDLRQAVPMSIESDNWSYLEEPYKAEDRLSVEFPYGSDIVKAVGWGVRTDEKEESLDEAKALFPKANFVKQKHPDINPHAGSPLVFYKDAKLGIIIFFNDYQGKVESISWMEPAEVSKRTALENFQYPEFCIQDHCARSSPEIERKLSGEEN